MVDRQTPEMQFTIVTVFDVFNIAVAKIYKLQSFFRFSNVHQSKRNYGQIKGNKT